MVRGGKVVREERSKKRKMGREETSQPLFIYPAKRNRPSHAVITWSTQPQHDDSEHTALFITWDTTYQSGTS